MSIATKDEITGKRNSVYAADLASLREMEKKINKDMDDLLITDASVKKLTVNTLFERYMATKNIKERTKKNYIRMWIPDTKYSWKHSCCGFQDITCKDVLFRIVR